MSRKRARRLQRSRKVTAFILSVMLFLSILSYAGLALAAELNTVRFNMRISSFRLNGVEALVDADNPTPPSTGAPAVSAVDTTGTPLPDGTATEDLPEVDSPVNQTKDAPSTPVTETKPNASEAGYTTEEAQVSGSGATTEGEIDITTNAQVENQQQQITTDGSLVTNGGTQFSTPEAAAAGVPQTGNIDTATDEEMKAIVEEIFSDYNENNPDGKPDEAYDPAKKYFVEKTGETISADQTAKVITSEITKTGQRYLYNPDGTVQTDANGNPITEEVVIGAGSIQVEVTASATLGEAAVFSAETVPGKTIVPQKNVVLTLDVSNSMGYEGDVDGDGDQEVKWAVLCEAVQSFVKELYGCTTDTNGNPVVANKNIVLDLVLFADSWQELAHEEHTYRVTPSKLDLSGCATDAEANTLIQSVLKGFSGVLSDDKLYNGYTETKSILGIEYVDNTDPLATTDGSNLEAGYNAALTAVNRIKTENEDKEGFDASDITVIFMTDGIATSYVSGIVDGRVVHATEYDNIFPVDNLIMNESREQAAEAEKRLLESGIHLVNVAINGPAEGESADNNQRKMDAIRDYMDPNYVPMKEQPKLEKPEETREQSDISENMLPEWAKDRRGNGKVFATQTDADGVKTTYLREKHTEDVQHDAGWYYGKYYWWPWTERIITYTWNKKEVTPAVWGTETVPTGNPGTLGSKLDADAKSRVTYSENANDAVMAAAARIKGELAAETVNTPATTAIKKVASAAIAAYEAKLISVVPSGFDVVVNPDAAAQEGVSFTVRGKDGAGNTVIEWNISQKALYGNEGFQHTYFLLPNSELGENYKFGTVLTSDSSILYCKALEAGGKEYAIVLDRPVATLAADANADTIAEYLSSIGSGATVLLGNVRENDSIGEKGNHPEQKLRAYQTVVGNGLQFGMINDGGTYVAVDGLGIDVKYQVRDTVDTDGDGILDYSEPNAGSGRTFTSQRSGNGYDIYENRVKVGVIAIDGNGDVSFTRTLDGFSLEENARLRIQINYKLNFDRVPSADMADVVDAQQVGHEIMNRRDVLQSDIAKKETALANAEQGSPEAQRLQEEIKGLRNQLLSVIKEETVWQNKYDAFLRTVLDTVETSAIATVNLLGGTPPQEPEPGPVPGPGPDVPDGPDGPVIPDDVPEEIIPEEIPLEGPVNEPGTKTEAAAVETIPGEPTPMAAGGESSWALLNLILTVATALASGLSLAGYATGKRKGMPKRGIMRLLSLVPAAGSILAFLLTQNLGNTMAFTDQWTLLMAAIAAIQAGLVVLNVKGEKAAPEEV